MGKEKIMLSIVNDQYYTNSEEVKKVWATLKENLPVTLLNEATFVEPSVGSGEFVLNSPVAFSKWLIFDIDPHVPSTLSPLLTTGDFLKLSPRLFQQSSPVITIGNPPFGHRSSLAVSFINKAASFSKVICFILPIQFDKYLTQQRLDPSLNLIFSRHLQSDAFHSLNGDAISSIRTGLYIFTSDKNLGTDHRIRKAPATAHPDFESWQYNRTTEAEKFFDKRRYGWDFAILRQGYGDYTNLEKDPRLLNHKKQYIFIKLNAPIAHTVFEKMDFVKLSQKNTTIPGFGKADLVAYYEKVKASIVH